MILGHEIKSQDTFQGKGRMFGIQILAQGTVRDSVRHELAQIILHLEQMIFDHHFAHRGRRQHFPVNNVDIVAIF